MVGVIGFGLNNDRFEQGPGLKAHSIFFFSVCVFDI
jgi:hypothetical protein